MRGHTADSHCPRRDKYGIGCITQAAQHFRPQHPSTGWMSVGELAITPKISLVAVCCSNASIPLSSLKQPHVLDGDHGLVGEGFEQLDLRRGKGTHFDAAREQSADEFPLLTKGNGQEGAQGGGGYQPSGNRSARARRECGVCRAHATQRNRGSSILQLNVRLMGMGPK